LQTLRRLLDRVRRPVRLRLMPGLGISQCNGHLPFLLDLHAVLGNAVPVEVRTELPYAEYMGQLEASDLALDSFHFAGCNGIADALFVRRPVVVWEGNRWYNRIGPAMLRLAGFADLVATSAEEYLALALDLIHNDARRADVTARLRAADLDATVFSTRDADAFRRAVDYLGARHERLRAEGSRTPIRIE
jgi:hypothetical protein